MLWYELVVYFFLDLISQIILVLVYSSLTKKRIKEIVNVKNIIIILVASILSMINALYNNTLSKNLIQLLIIIFLNKLFFKDDFKKTLIYSLLSYLTMLIVEIVLSIIFVIVSVDSAKEFNKLVLFKTVFSFVVMSITFLLCKIKKISEIYYKIYKILSKASDNIIIIII